MMIECTECEGCGREDCPSCDGSGIVNGSECSQCYGDGDIACQCCGGRGVVKAIETPALHRALGCCGF